MARRGSLTFADTSWQKAVSDGLAVALPLLLPQAAAGESAGGFMAVGLRGLGVVGAPSNQKFWKPAAGTDQVHVVFDSGSEGFFVVDDTGDDNDVSLLDQVAGIYSANATYALDLGSLEQDAPHFTVFSPPQWRSVRNGMYGKSDPSQRAPFRPEAGGNPRSQSLVVGNMWMTCLSVTFSLSRIQLPGESRARQHVILSYLNGSGKRTKNVLDIKSAAFERSAATLPPRRHKKLPAGWTPRGWKGPSVADVEFSAAASSKPPDTDATVPLVFVTQTSSGQMQETDSVDVLAEPAIKVSLDGGPQTTPIVDTGSGTNILILPKDQVGAMTIDPCVKNKSCQCSGSGAIGEVFQRHVPNSLKLSSSEYPTKTGCNVSMLDHEAHCDSGVCCSSCCLAAGLSATDHLPCSVSYCTGVLGYRPAEARVSLDSPKLSAMDNVFVAQGFKVCEPDVSSGILGMWYWMRPQQDNRAPSAVEQEHATTLPYHALRHLGQLSGNNNNFTMSIWRTDAKSDAAPPDPLAPSPPPTPDVSPPSPESPSLPPPDPPQTPSPANAPSPSPTATPVADPPPISQPPSNSPAAQTGPPPGPSSANLPAPDAWHAKASREGGGLIIQAGNTYSPSKSSDSQSNDGCCSVKLGWRGVAIALGVVGALILLTLLLVLVTARTSPAAA